MREREGDERGEGREGEGERDKEKPAGLISIAYEYIISEMIT